MPAPLVVAAAGAAFSAGLNGIKNNVTLGADQKTIAWLKLISNNNLKSLDGCKIR